MKKLSFILLLLISVSSYSYAQNNKPHLKLGGGIGFGDWARTDDGWEEKWGSGINLSTLVYNNECRFSLATSFIYFPVAKFSFSDDYFSTQTTYEVDPAMYYINVEGRFSFVKRQKVECSLFLGPSFLVYSESISLSNASNEISWENDDIFKYGAITGLGMNLNLSDNLNIYLDGGYSYIADDWDQVLITAGILFRVF